MSPVEELNTKFDSLLLRLPCGWEELAVETHAFTRARQIKSPKDLLHAVFSYAVADYSLREVAAVLIRGQKWMSDQAVYSRLGGGVQRTAVTATVGEFGYSQRHYPANISLGLFNSRRPRRSPGAGLLPFA